MKFVLGGFNFNINIKIGKASIYRGIIGIPGGWKRYKSESDGISAKLVKSILETASLNTFISYIPKDMDVASHE